MPMRRERACGFILLGALAFLGGCSEVAQQEGAQRGVPSPRVYGGSLDKVDCDFISGWAWDYTHPDDPVTVQVYGDDNLVGETKAALFRPDLAAAGKGKGEHGFKFPTPKSIKDGTKHNVRVRVAGDNVDLKRCPLELRCDASDD